MLKFLTDQNLKNLAPVLLRYGLVFVFLWFGVSQLINPEAWTSYLPDLVNSLPLTQITFILLNGWFELVGAVMLLLGAYTRPVALLLALHLYGIALTVGFDAIGVRDIGLATATLAIACFGAGKWSIDTKFSN